VVVPLTTGLVPAVVGMHRAAFPRSEASCLGERYACAFIDWFSRRHGAVALVAMDDEGPCGYAVGLQRDDLPELYRALLPTVVRCLILRPWVWGDPAVRQMALQRLALLARRVPARLPAETVPQPTWYLHTVGVVPHAQRTGVGRQLLVEIEATVRVQGPRSMLLATPRANAPARALYEDQGWAPLGPADCKRIYYVRRLGA